MTNQEFIEILEYIKTELKTIASSKDERAIELRGYLNGIIKVLSNTQSTITFPDINMSPDKTPDEALRDLRYPSIPKPDWWRDVYCHNILNTDGSTQTAYNSTESDKEKSNIS